MTNETAASATETGAVAEQGANVAPETTTQTKDASQKKGAPKAPKAAKKAKAAKKETKEEKK